ncbi:MAG: T9SS type A sorting domain-containing protein [Chitinophagales bacterium]|nr:T9SS type A sorting domain-containing protein [Chitinophagales bacterium]
MKKTLLSLLLLSLSFLFCNQYVNGQTKTITIDLTSVGGAANIGTGNYGGDAERTWTIDNIEFGGKDITAGSGGNAGKIQVKASNGIFYNTTALPGNIVSITINYSGTARTYDCFGGNSSRLVNSTAGDFNVTGGTQVGSSSSTGWVSSDFDNTDYTFFAIKRASTGASYINSIEIEYEDNSGPVDPATQLVFNNVPTTGVPNSILSPFHVKAVASDGVTVDVNYTTDITITKASGPGNLTGTTVKTPISGMVTFTDLQFDAPGTYTLTASSGSLTSATTADIVVADGTVNTDHFRARAISGDWSSTNSWESSHDSLTWILATSAPDDNASSIVIPSVHTINVDLSTITAKNLLVNGGTLTILPSMKLTVNNDGTAAKDMIIQGGGTVLNKGTLTIGSGATWQVKIDGTFIQNTTSGISTPLNSATLDAGSDFIYRGSSTLGITPSVSGKTYGNLTLESESGQWSTSASGSGAFTVNGTLSVGDSVSWNISSYTGTMTVAENIYVSGVLTATSFSITSTKSLIVNPTGTLIVPTGKTVDVSAGSGILKSDNTGTANIGNSAGTIIGSFTQERYIPAKAVRKWSLISSPFTQTISDSWQQQIHITGAGTGGTVCPTLTTNSNGFDATVSNAPSMYVYDASQSQGNRWMSVANTDQTNIGQGVGFRVNVRGDRSLGCTLLDGTSMSPSAVTLKSTGLISSSLYNAGNFTLTYPNNGIDNYVLIGNPYPSAISFSALQTSNSSAINNVYAIYLPANNAGVYTYWDGVTGHYIGGDADMNFDNSKGDIIANGQSIFIKSAVVGDVSLDFNESQKLNENNTGYFRTPRVFNEMLKVGLSQNNHQIDEAVIRFANDADINNLKEGKLDISSMNSGTFISSIKVGKNMALQTRELRTLNNDEVWLNIGATESGTYQLSFSDFENFVGTEIILKDHYTNTIQNIKQNDKYEFNIDINNAATKGSTRFSIVFNRTINPIYVSNIIKLYPNPANKQVTLELPKTSDNNIIYNVRVTDILGKVVISQKVNTTSEQLNISKLRAGVYFIEVIDSNGNKTTEKLIKQ